MDGICSSFFRSIDLFFYFVFSLAIGSVLHKVLRIFACIDGGGIQLSVADVNLR